MTNDFIMSSQLLSAEACEYVPKGEGWKYFLEGRTNFDGDRPVNTNGGRASSVTPPPPPVSRITTRLSSRCAVRWVRRR